MASDQSPTLTDEEIRDKWRQAQRLYGRNSLGRRIAFGMVDRLEAQGVTEADIDRVMS